MELYFVSVILEPTKKQSEEGVQPKIVVEPIAVLATDQGHAIAKALKYVPEEHSDADSRLLVRVIPFQKPSK